MAKARARDSVSESGACMWMSEGKGAPQSAHHEQKRLTTVGQVVDVVVEQRDARAKLFAEPADRRSSLTQHPSGFDPRDEQAERKFSVIVQQ